MDEARPARGRERVAARGLAAFLSPSLRPWGLVTAAGCVACAASLGGFLGPFAWYFDLCAHFRVQYFLGLTAAALLLLIPRHVRTAAAFGAAALLNLACIVPLYTTTHAQPPPGRVQLCALLMNVNSRAGDPARVAEAIRQFMPDLLVLEEVDESWLTALAPALAAYPHGHATPRDDNFGIAFYSRIPLTSVDTVYLGDAGLPSILAQVQTADGPLTLLATHPLPPAGREGTRQRNLQLEAVAQRVRQMHEPVLLLGDLNASPWSGAFRKLVAVSGLRDATRGVHATWPTFDPLLRIPIDHCLHSPGILILSESVGPPVGSDHYPLVVTFAAAGEGLGARR